jgi:hypothetical protein
MYLLDPKKEPGHPHHIIPHPPKSERSPWSRPVTLLRVNNPCSATAHVRRSRIRRTKKRNNRFIFLFFLNTHCFSFLSKILWRPTPSSSHGPEAPLSYGSLLYGVISVRSRKRQQRFSICEHSRVRMLMFSTHFRLDDVDFFEMEKQYKLSTKSKFATNIWCRKGDSNSN